MRVLHLSASDLGGGAARAAFRLHQGLQRLGHDSRMLVAARKGDDPAVMEVGRSRRLSDRFRRRWRRAQLQLLRRRWAIQPSDPFHLARTDYQRDLDINLDQVDVLHLHWISDFVDLPSWCIRYGRQRPIVWTLHDMNPLTGGCHHDLGCERYREQCGCCPRLHSRREHDLSRRIWREKRTALGSIDASRFRCVANSRWMAAKARASSLLGPYDIRTIALAVETDVFRPLDREACRRALEVPPDRKVVLFMAHTLRDPYKGYDLLKAALEQIAARVPLLLLVVGRGKVEPPAGMPCRFLGRILARESLAECFGAADVFANPSRAESFGQTCLEAMACGVPSVGFKVGGVPEAIRDGITGRIVPDVRADSFAAGLCELLEQDDARHAMGAACRDLALREFTLERQARDYVKLYEEIAAMHGARPA